MNTIKPQRLRKGDLIGIISPASAPDDLTRIEKGVQYLEKLGYRTLIGKNSSNYYGYLAGTDEERVSDLHDMFKNKEVKAIFCTRGGYGTPRLLNRIDYRLIKKNPKIFVGYSDITALQLAFYKKCGLITFAGPMLAVDFYNNVSSFTEEFFWSLVTSNKKLGKIKQPENKSIKKYLKNSAEGVVLGGNLALVTSIMGTEYFPSFENKILMIEEVGESPYRVDRLLNQLKLAKVFEKVNGVLVGEFTDCDEEDSTKRSLTLDQVFDDYLSGLNVNVTLNFQHGHIKDTITVPFGTKIKINSLKENIEFLESAVE